MASKKELTNGKYIDDQMGNGVPEGGSFGQVLKKNSDADYDVGWGTVSSSSSTSPGSGTVTSINTSGLLVGGPITTSGTISTSINSGKLVGRSSSGTGVMEEITVGTGLSLYGGTLTAASSGGGILHGTASGTDTYTATITGPSAYVDGDAYLIRFTNGNTTGCTLNINSLGAKTLYRNNDGALIGGDIIAGAEMLCVYNSTLNGFQAIGTSPNTLLSYVTNVDSVSITKGMPVYAFGGTGDRMTVKRAYNTGDSTSAQTVGIVLSTSIGVNQKGLIMMQGLLDGLSILPTSTWSDGSPVYLGSTAGSITNVKPSAPNHLVYLGVVTTASNGAAGRMYVRVQNGYELDEIHDVALAQPPNNNDVLMYESSTSLWKNKPVATISNVVADLTVGAITAGNTIASGTTLQQFVEALLIKIYYPTLNAPTFSLSNNQSNPEIGTTVSVLLTFNFNRGSILGSTSGTWNPSYFQNYRAGAATNYVLNGTSTGTTNTRTITGVTVAATNSYTGTVTYATGPQPLDSKGNNYSTPLAGATSPSQPTSFTGIYPYYWYKSNSPITASGMQSAIASGAATKVVGDSNGTITINFAATGQYLAVAYPDSSTTKTVWYVNALDNGTIPGGVFGGATVLACSSSSGYWSSVNYKIHVTAGLITQSNDMELRN